MVGTGGATYVNRLELTRRLDEHSVRELAHALNIAVHERRQWGSDEADTLLDWLSDRNRLSELGPALSLIGREDLLPLLNPTPTQDGGASTASNFLETESSSTPPASVPSVEVTAPVTNTCGTQVIGSNNVVNPQATVDALIAAHQQTVSAKDEHIYDLKKQLEAVVGALQAEQAKPDARPEIGEALAMLAKGEKNQAEAVFEAVSAAATEQGRAGFRQAAEAQRHIGALAVLDDTEKALKAYRRATELDPDNTAGWNELGFLLHRIGELNEAESAYRRVEGLVKTANDHCVLAATYGNLGIVYKTRGELDKAVAMYKKSLALNETLGRKEGMAIAYGNLGNVHQIRGELDKAVEMHRKSLALNEVLGRKEAYGNLGIVYKAWGELDKAEEMFKKSLALDEALGRKEGMAINYVNLGNVYQTRGELDKAVEMYHQSLAIEEALGRKKGMAINNVNHGIVYEIRGDLSRAQKS